MSRSLWRLRLPASLPVSSLPSVSVQPVFPGDGPALAELMLSAYQGTIDDEGGTLADAQVEITRLFGGEYGPFLPEVSRVVWQAQRPVSAALLTRWGEEHRPLLAFSMTAADHKRRGLGRHALLAAIAALTATGAESLDLFVTDGNFPAESLYKQLGFQRPHNI